jgi:hypothetical protein
MSSIIIKDLARTRALDTHAMSAIRGGQAFGPNVNVNLNLDQRIAQLQDIKVNVLNNNGSIGSGFTAPDVTLNPLQWATNNAVVPL